MKRDTRVEGVVRNRMEGDCWFFSTLYGCCGWKRGGSTDRHRGVGQLTTRGAGGRVRGVLATYHTQQWVNQ